LASITIIAIIDNDRMHRRTNQLLISPIAFAWEWATLQCICTNHWQTKFARIFPGPAAETPPIHLVILMYQLISGNPQERAKPTHAGDGLPAPSNATFSAGPDVPLAFGLLFCQRSTNTAKRRGVAKYFAF